MSRNLPWLAELQPEMFAEIDPVLAAERGIEDGGWMTISHRARRDRGAREGDRAHAAAAHRRPDRAPGRAALALGLRRRRVTGDSANDLMHLSGDPNVTIETSKAFTCDVRAGRRDGAADRAAAPTRRTGTAAPTADHPAEQPKLGPDAA